MPKNQFVCPDNMRKPGFIEFTPIPVNQYDRSIADELAAGEVSAADLIGMHRDMSILRTFETMLNEIKLRGQWEGVEYDHRGPAHLSIGQESAAVGQAFLLDVDDHVYGSHRSHSEILAKGLSAIAKLDDASLMATMEGYFDGEALRIVEGDADGDTTSLATDYLIYGALAEIFARETGFNKGLGGSMHAFFPPFGIMPNNAIVGGSGDVSVGAALYKKCNQAPGMVICNIGDASAACGPVWEGLMLASMDQYKTLWPESYRGGLPILFNFVNNHYGMGGQTCGETMGYDMLARMGAGINPEQMHAERIDGFNPLAVVDAMRRKKDILSRGDGPVLMDTVTYRYSGHSPSDASSYRTKEEMEAWKLHDPLTNYAASLVEADVCTQGDIDAINEQSVALVFKAFRKAVDPDVSPYLDLVPAGSQLEQTMFSNGTVVSMDTSREPETTLPYKEDPRSKMLAKRSRSGYDADGKALGKQRCIGLRDALFEAIRDGFYTDPTLIAYGEENRDWGGAFGVYRGLTEALPYNRLFNSPISEGAICGSACGYSMEGGRVLVELMYCDFLGRAGDEIFNQLSKWQSMSGDILQMSAIIRVSVGSKYGAQHSQDWTSMVAHVPGLKVAFPVTPYDAKGLMNASLRGTDPVIFFESQRVYDVPELFVEGGVPEDFYTVEFGEPAIRREGTDLTILTVGATMYRALEAADRLESEFGLSVEVIDARSLVPFNYDKVIESVSKTHNILLSSDACERGSFLHTMGNTISQLAFDELDAPPIVVGSRNWITPAAEQEDAFFPQPSDMIDAIHTQIKPLPGYTPERENSLESLRQRFRDGL